MKKLLNKKGFTLIELIVVIAIIAILAAILIPALLDYINAAEVSKNTSNARSNFTAAMLVGATNDGSLATFVATGDDCSLDAGSTYPDNVSITCGTGDNAVTVNNDGVVE